MRIKTFVACLLVSFVVPAAGHAYTSTVMTNYTWDIDGLTYDYASDVNLGQSWIGQHGAYASSMNWDHALPALFEDAAYQVTTAKLWVDAQYMLTDGNSVTIDGIELGHLANTRPDHTTFNLTPVLSQLNWSDGMVVGVNANENGFRLDQAKIVFNVSYNPLGDDDGPAPVPDPATLLLFGTGLAGLGAARRRRKS